MREGKKKKEDRQKDEKRMREREMVRVKKKEGWNFQSKIYAFSSADTDGKNHTM